MTAPGAGEAGTGASSPALTRAFQEDVARPPAESVRDLTPFVRGVGLALLAVAVPVHDLLRLGRFDPPGWGMFAGSAAVYALVATLLSRGEPGTRRPASRIALPVMDVAFAAAAVYLTGSTWMAPVLLAPAAARVGRGVHQTLLLASLGLLAEVGVLGIFTLAHDGPPPDRAGAASLLLLALGAVFLVAVAWTVERDRTQLRKQAEDAVGSIRDLREDATYLDESRRRAERAGLDRSAFLARVGEQLRPPLRGMLRAAHRLEEMGGSRVQRANAREIRNSARYLLDVVNEVTDLARVQTGTAACEIRPVTVRTALEYVLDRARPAAEARSLRIVAPGLRELEARVLADEPKLRQAFANLISNAVKYGGTPGEIEVRTIERDGRLRVEVADSGPGIPGDRIEEAFEPFQRLGAELTDVGGTGLGLTVSRAIVEAMRGRLGLESRPDTGTIAWIELPLHRNGHRGSTSGGGPTPGAA